MAAQLPGGGRVNEAVTAWLRDRPGWAGARVDEIAGGRSHTVWRLTAAHRSGVLKLDAEPRVWPGNSRDEEARVQRLAAAADLAAPVDWHSPAGILTDWLDGVVLGPAALRDERMLSDVGAALRELHALPPTARHFDLARWAGHYRTVLGAGGRLDDAARAACDRLAAASLPGPYVMSHNDLVPANIVACERIRFIDWEYAATNSWLFDLATLHVEAELDADATALLFASYAGRPSIPAAFAEAVAVYRQLSELWEVSALPAVS